MSENAIASSSVVPPEIAVGNEDPLAHTDESIRDISNYVDVIFAANEKIRAKILDRVLDRPADGWDNKVLELSDESVWKLHAGLEMSIPIEKESKRGAKKFQEIGGVYYRSAIGLFGAIAGRLTVTTEKPLIEFVDIVLEYSPWCLWSLRVEALEAKGFAYKGEMTVHAPNRGGMAGSLDRTSKNLVHTRILGSKFRTEVYNVHAAARTMTPALLPSRAHRSKKGEISSATPQVVPSSNVPGLDEGVDNEDKVDDGSRADEGKDESGGGKEEEDLEFERMELGSGREAALQTFEKNAGEGSAAAPQNRFANDLILVPSSPSGSSTNYPKPSIMTPFLTTRKKTGTPRASSAVERHRPLMQPEHLDHRYFFAMDRERWKTMGEAQAEELAEQCLMAGKIREKAKCEEQARVTEIKDIVEEMETARRGVNLPAAMSGSVRSVEKRWAI